MMAENVFSMEFFHSVVDELRKAGSLGEIEFSSINFLLEAVPENYKNKIAVSVLLLLWESGQGRVRLLWNVETMAISLEELFYSSSLPMNYSKGTVSSFIKTLGDYDGIDFDGLGVIAVVDGNGDLNEEALPTRPLVLLRDEFGKKYLYLQKNYVSELRIIRGFQQRLLRNELDDSCLDMNLLEDLFIKRSFLAEGQQFHLMQGVASILAARSPFFLLSGGPGTGKTSVLLQVLRIFFSSQSHLSPSQVALVAPTGRAKARMQESIESGLSRLKEDAEVESKIRSLKTQTLHRLLGVENDDRFQQPKKLLHQLVVIDEASMVDIHLMGRLLERLNPEASLIFLGDVDQLPSVEHGAILGDLSIESSTALATETYVEFKDTLNDFQWDGDWEERWQSHDRNSVMLDRIITLEHTYRSAQGILDLASSLRGVGIDQMKTLEILKKSEFSYKEDSSLKEILATTTGENNFGDLIHIESGATERVLEDWWLAMDKIYGQLEIEAQSIENSFEIAELNPSQIERGHELMEKLDLLFERMTAEQVLCIQHEGPRGTHAVRELARARKKQYSQGDSFSTGQRVLIKKNLGALDLYNGDVGLVIYLGGEALVIFKRGMGYIDVALSRIEAFVEPADAITVHKSQGSEYGQVLLLLPEKDHPMVTREILYTGITRAKHRVVMMGSSSIIESGAKKSVHRPSRLGDWIRTSQKV